MKLIFDARLMALEFTGLGRYTALLLKTLLKERDNPDFHITILLDSGTNWEGNMHYNALLPLMTSDQMEICHIDAAPLSFRQHLSVSKWVNQREADQYFYPHFDLPANIKKQKTLVIHDLLPLVVPNYTGSFALLKKFYFRNLIIRNVKRADRCITISETTKKDIVRLTGLHHASKIDVVGEGPFLKPAELNPAELRCVPDEKFLLYVGDRRPHKNLRRIVDVFMALRLEHGYPGKLVIIGSTRNFDFDLDAHIGENPDILVLGNVSDATLAAYYAKTDALIFLSEYEGFGLPVVEAANFNRKMLLSDGGSLAEIAPEQSCILPRSLSVPDAAAKAHPYLASHMTIDYSDFISRYSWERTAREIFPEAFT